MAAPLATNNVPAAKLRSATRLRPNGLNVLATVMLAWPMPLTPMRPAAPAYGKMGRLSPSSCEPSFFHTSGLTNKWSGRKLVASRMSVAASYSAEMSDDGLSAVTVHVLPDADAPLVMASHATSSDLNMYWPTRSRKMISIAPGLVKSMSCTDKVTCPASVVFVTTLLAMTGVVADTGFSSGDCAATDGCVVHVGRINVLDCPPSGIARAPTAATTGRV